MEEGEKGTGGTVPPLFANSWSRTWTHTVADVEGADMLRNKKIMMVIKACLKIKFIR